jgi:hypothetical protein
VSAVPVWYLLDFAAKLKLLIAMLLQRLGTLSWLALAVAGTTSLGFASAARANTYRVTQSSWGTSTDGISLAWALAKANANPGLDTITIDAGLAINVDAATPLTSDWLTTITDNLAIQGNGATLVGDPKFIGNGGATVYDKFNVDVYKGPPTDFLTQQAYSFAKVTGGVDVSIDQLGIDGLNGYLQLGNAATATLTGASARNTVSYGSVGRSVFDALDHSVLNLTKVVLDRINPELDSIGAAWSGAIAGSNATLNMVGSTINRAASAAGAVNWTGGVANVVSSIITQSGGLSIADDTKAGVMNLVNSLVDVYAQNSDIQRLQAILGGELNITASSILQNALYNSYNGCGVEPYNCAGKPLTALEGGTITLKQSLVSLLNTDQIPPGVDSYSEAALGYASGGNIVALDSVWIQPTPTQDAAALQSLLGNPAVLTAGLPLVLDDLGGGVTGYLPLPNGAYPNPTGPLVNQIANADGANQLLSPIDGSVISVDVLGNPRTRNGLRNIGALQAPVPGPLPLAGAAAALGWSRRLRRRLDQR